MLKVCITGIAGFIGMHTALALKKKGYAVVGFDHFSPIDPPSLRYDRQKELKKLDIDCETLELCDASALRNFYDRHQPDLTIHLAAKAGVRQSIEEPMSFIQTNIVGFVTLLEVLKDRATCPLIYASSSSVYGTNTKVPFSESDRSDHQVSLYGATKKSNELIAHAYHHLYSIPMTGLRFFTVYGPWGRPDMACWLFTKAIFEEKPIRLFNQGKMKRDFTYVDDIVAGILACVEAKASFAVYNLGGSHCHPLVDFVRKIEKATGKTAIIDHQPMQPGDVLCTHADVTLSDQALHFKPKVSLEVGLKRFVDWYRTYHKLA